MSNIDPNAIEQHWKLLVLFLKEVCEDKKISQQELAELTGLKQSNISRMFSLKYCPNLRTYMTIAKALDLNLYFETKESNTEMNVLFERAMEQLGRRPNRLPLN